MEDRYYVFINFKGVLSDDNLNFLSALCTVNDLKHSIGVRGTLLHIKFYSKEDFVGNSRPA